MINMQKIFLSISIVFILLIKSSNAQYSMAELIGSDVSLPVNLISYNFEQVNKQIKIEWTVATEIDNLGFSIERQSEFQNEYQFVASYKTDPNLLGEGNSSALKKYSFYDEFEIFGNYGYKIYSISINGDKNLFISDHINTNPDLALPDQFQLLNIFPNPFNSETNIVFYTPTDGNVKLDIYNVLGKKMVSSKSSNYTKGNNKIKWKANNFPSGVYIVHLHFENQTIAKRILYLK